MTQPLITVSHHEDAYEVERMCSPAPERHGIAVWAEITYRPDQTTEALEAVDRLAANLRRLIADAAESRPMEGR